MTNEIKQTREYQIIDLAHQVVDKIYGSKAISGKQYGQCADVAVQIIDTCRSGKGIERFVIDRYDEGTYRSLVPVMMQVDEKPADVNLGMFYHFGTSTAYIYFPAY